PKKRSKGAHAKGSRTEGTSSKSKRHGKLEMLPELNLDVLFHIFTFLRPMDLLNLARTTKAFRRLLMRKSLAFVWAAARKQTEQDFPDCPPDLSEPQYANLAFYPHCHVLVSAILLELHGRFTGGCGCVIVWDAERDGMLLFSGYLMFTISFRNSLHSLGSKIPNLLNVLPSERYEFVSQRRNLVSDINEHAKQCEAWFNHVDVARKYELMDAQTEREERFETEINYFGQDTIAVEQDHIFRSSKQLTERGTIYVASPMEIEVYRPRRNLLTILYDDYVRNPPPTGPVVDLLPPLGDVIDLVPFDMIIKLPEDVKVDNATFKLAFDQLPTLTGEWKARAEAQLASLVNIPANIPAAEQYQEKESESNVERLKLASAVFEVKWGLSRGELLAYPDILAHPVFDNHLPGSTFYSEYTRVWSLLDSCGTRVVELFCRASHVVRLCGLDPHTATVDHMDRRNPRLICRQCN
ncbi:hypothetical protein PAXINDRAFT_42323, partial [Paxillus involutus ATCC 200175]